MSRNDKEDLDDNGYIDSIIRNNSILGISIVLKTRLPTSDVIAYIGCISDDDEFSIIMKTMKQGVKLSREEALVFFPSHSHKIIRNYFKN